MKVPFPYSPINASSLPFMIAKDAKIFEKYGLDVDLVFYGSLGSDYSIDAFRRKSG